MPVHEISVLIASVNSDGLGEFVRFAAQAQTHTKTSHCA